MKLSNLTYQAIGKGSFALDVIILIIHSARGKNCCLYITVNRTCQESARPISASLHFVVTLNQQGIMGVSAEFPREIQEVLK